MAKNQEYPKILYKQNGPFKQKQAFEALNNPMIKLLKMAHLMFLQKWANL